MPHKTLIYEDGKRMIWNTRRLSSDNLRQLSQGTQRIPLPIGHPLRVRMAERGLDLSTVPQQMTGSCPKNTLDTPENRFVKHALSIYVSFLDSMARLVRTQGRMSDYVLLRDMGNLQMQLKQVLSEPFFRSISRPSVIPLWSPVLQRKPGYREFLQAWLSFGLAAQLVWTGGDDVYRAGKKDMDVLYEYWVFFALLDLVSHKFELDAPLSQHLIEHTGNGLDLKLKAGRTLTIDGECMRYPRPMKVQFNYNKTFSYNRDPSSAGSWTRPMRPDFTLSIWPAAFSAREAERQELMAHLHFDAKYRIDDLRKLMGRTGSGADLEDVDVERERLEEKRSIYKHGDLLKMHAYRDAIRRSQGAYIIYPGDENKLWETYHEILPGLGAFALRPGEEDGRDGLRALGRFIDDVIEHLCDRATQRERLSFYRYKVSSQKRDYSVMISMPEKAINSDKRAVPLADELVLVVPEGANSISAIMETGRVQLEIGEGQLFSLDPSLVLAKYILVLAERGGTASLWQVSRSDLTVANRDAVNTNENQRSGLCLVYSVIPEQLLTGIQWDWAAVASRCRLVGYARSIGLDELLSLAK
jgi:predicted component of viral defense system (DUF524 family)